MPCSNELNLLVHTMFKSIIFDWGGVLIDDPEPGFLAYLSNYFHLPEEKLREAREECWMDFQRGTISEQEYWQKCCAVIQKRVPADHSFYLNMCRKVFHERPTMFELVQSCKEQGYTVALLSNCEVPPMQYFHENLEKGYNVFEVTTFSAAEGCIKPEPLIYERTLTKLGVEPTEAIFIDDKVKYVEGAQAVGIHGILFQSEEQVRRELQGLGIKIK